MDGLTDKELLLEYTERRSEAAFAELVRRYIDLVHSAALRMVRDSHLAEDVTQGVFMALARGASQLADRPVLSGWLHRTTQNIAANSIRSAVRSRAREREAAAMNELLSTEPDALWEQVAPHLDAALGQLGEADRDAILLRYFQYKSAREIGQILGTSEHAAQRRLSRAIERLREHLSKRGVAVTASSLSLAISANAVQATPAMLGTMISGSAALLSSVGTQHSTAAGITKMIAMTTMQKSLIATTIVVALGTGLYQGRRASDLERQLTILQRQQDFSANAVRQLPAQGELDNLQRENEQLRVNMAELPRLREEVTRLRNESRELAKLKAAGPAADDPSVAIIKDWAVRTTLLKKKLAEMPGAKIPELQFLTEKNWVDAAKDTDLNNEYGVREALANLRRAAKSTVLDVMQTALNKYGDANNKVLPADLSQLKPYFSTPLDDAVLARYNLVQTGKLSDDPSKPVLNEIAPSVDAEYDSHFQLTMNGRMIDNVNGIGDEVAEAAKEFARNNSGRIPREASEISPYLKDPIPEARLQEYLDKASASPR